jgi:YggT family protein
MLDNALLFLINAVLGLITLAFLLRFFLQLTRASFQNPAAEMIMTVTNFAVKPMRKVTAYFKNFGFKKIDTSTLLLAYISQVILKLSTLWLTGFPLLIAGDQMIGRLLLAALVSVVSISLTIFMYAVLIQSVLSWVNPHTAIAPILNNLTQPILKVIRKFVPMAGNIDLSPLVFIILAQLLLTTILMPFEHSLLLTR